MPSTLEDMCYAISFVILFLKSAKKKFELC